MQHKPLVIGSLLALLAAPALAQQTSEEVPEPAEDLELHKETNFSTWDSDGNGEVTQQEWAVNFNPEILHPLDADDDGLVNEPEILESRLVETGENSYEIWDQDGDGYLSMEEMQEGLFSAYDENSNDRIGTDEFNSFRDRHTQETGS